MAYLSADDRRESILDAAVDVIASEGLAKMTTRRIAERAGAPLGALHYCFRNKEELLDLVFNRARDTLKASFKRVDPSRGSRGNDPRQRRCVLGVDPREHWPPHGPRRADDAGYPKQGAG